MTDPEPLERCCTVRGCKCRYAPSKRGTGHDHVRAGCRVPAPLALNRMERGRDLTDAEISGYLADNQGPIRHGTADIGTEIAEKLRDRLAAHDAALLEEIRRVDRGEEWPDDDWKRGYRHGLSIALGMATGEMPGALEARLREEPR